MLGQFVRFLLVGVLNTCVGLSVIFAAMGLLGLAEAPANAVGYAVGLCVSFVLNKRWTFTHDGRALAAALRFLFAFAIAYGLNLATVLGAIAWFGLDPYLAQALGVPPYTISFFLLSRYVVFRPSPLALRETLAK